MEAENKNYFNDEVQNNFKADFGFREPHRTTTKCKNPVFADQYLHRIAIMKDYHIGSNGDIDENGMPGWISKFVCTGCGKRFTINGNRGYFHPDSEAEKLESEKPTINGTTPDVVNLNSDTPKEYLFVGSNTSLSIDHNKINTSILQLHYNGNVILEFMANGDIFIKGELVENNIDVVNMLKDICNGKYVQQTESDSQKELIDLQTENKQLKERIKELEEEKSTTVNKVFDDVIQIEYAFCSKCNWQLDNVLANENFCPNCGRKIVR